MPRREIQKRTLRLPLASRVDQLFFGCYGVLLGIIGSSIVFGLATALMGGADGSGRAVPLAALFLSFVAITAFRVKTTALAMVEVGDDGLIVPGTFRKRFIPFGSVQKVSESTGAVGDQHLVLRLEDGSSAKFRLDAMNELERAELMGRFQASRRQHDEDKNAAPVTILDREGRSLEAWRESLREAFTADYRRAPLTLESMKATLANTAAPKERRIGAAFALIAREPIAARTNLDDVASGCADVDLREALLSIGRDEVGDAAILRALGGVRVEVGEESAKGAQEEDDEEAERRASRRIAE